MKILNAFSLSMLPLDKPVTLHVCPLTPFQAKCWAPGAESYVGHADTARIFSRVLERDIPVNRTSVKLLDKEMALVGQYTGPRLPEGATELPEGASIQWAMVVGVWEG